MAINIKNPEAVEAVRRLAEHLGVGYTKAIELAARQTLAASYPTADEQALARVSRIAAEYRAHLTPATTLDPDQLYNPDGLYR